MKWDCLAGYSVQNLFLLWRLRRVQGKKFWLLKSVHTVLGIEITKESSPRGWCCCQLRGHQDEPS